MASDLSSGCTEAIEVLDEKEEGEISLEDVSSSEEGHLGYGYGTRTPQCPNCLSTQHCTPWCAPPPKLYHPRNQNRRDTVQGKENRHHIKDSGCMATKNTSSTLQEKNDDLVPISSDSDMEIVGLMDSTKQLMIRTISGTHGKKKRKKKRSSALSIDDLVSSSSVTISDSVGTLKHHRETSPSHRSNRSRISGRSPSRKHRSPIRKRSPFKRSRSPIRRSRSPRRIRSPKRSPYRSPTTTIPRKQLETTANMHTYVESHSNVNKLLKKARQLDNKNSHSLTITSNKTKEHPASLMEKLTIMMKGVSDSNGNVTHYSKEQSNLHAKEDNDADDEEDLALLRQKALETKQKKVNKRVDQSKIESVKEENAGVDADQDVEDLQLRMIALRSAVLKKHQNRLKSGRSKKSTTGRSESPFTQSFLDSIPIPGEELLNFASPPRTPISMNENNHTEDMDLDTDVEREKEKLPYSPTDKITTDIPIDTELLGIQPSDVSFISLNEANSSPAFSTISTKDDPRLSLQGKIIENQSYLPDPLYQAGSKHVPYHLNNCSAPYSPTDPTETPRSNYTKRYNSHTPLHHYPEMSNKFKKTSSHSTCDFLDVNSSQEIPYSPTDTPLYDLDLSETLPRTPGSINIPIPSATPKSHYDSNIRGSVEQYNHSNTVIQISKESNTVKEEECTDKADTLSLDPAVGSATTSLMGSTSPTESLITIDDLPETDMDPSSPTDTVKNMKTMECTADGLSSNAKEKFEEPLYMQGVPNITKDANKIPTLINRTLVPVPILKTNKQLQQPLRAKKQEAHPEPAFKNAEMLPVTVSEEVKTNTIFKPMRIAPVTQKTQSMITPSNAFHDSLQEDVDLDASLNKNTSTLASKNVNTACVQNTASVEAKCSENVCDTSSMQHKKKKRTRKGLKRKSSNNDLPRKETNTVCMDGNNANTAEMQVNKENMSDQGQNPVDNIAKEAQNRKEESVESRMDQNINHLTDQEGTANTETTLIKNVETLKEVKTQDNRRESVDEDEEALRAILLASLPKRPKTTDNNTTNVEQTAPDTAPTNFNNEQSGNQVLVNPSPPLFNIIAGLNSNSMSPAPSQHSNSNFSEYIENEVKVNGVNKKDVSDGVPRTTIKPLLEKQTQMPNGPQKKLMKKAPIPASTKVLNNAKKYQNVMMQKRLNLQKAASLYANQKLTENKVIENKWSSSTKALSDTQRIVINLESDTESDSETERQRNKIISNMNSAAIDKPQPPINLRADFEKHLDELLKYTRKKQESVAVARQQNLLVQANKKDVTPAISLTQKQTDKTISSNLHTPLAVRHLPVSQQEEYRRLKQQIIEREKLKLKKKMEDNSSQKSKTIGTAPKSATSDSLNKELDSPGSNQTTCLRSPSITPQSQNKENNLGNSASPKSSPTLPTLTARKITSNTISKRITTGSSQSKNMMASVTNLSIQIPNDNVAPSNNVTGRIVGTSSLSAATPRTVIENVLSSQETTEIKSLPGLKILSKDEVNRKFVQIQVQQNTDKRIVTVNDKTSQNDKEAQKDPKPLENNEKADGMKNDNNITNYAETVEKQCVINKVVCDNHEGVDSDASTILLSRPSQNEDTKEESDTSESTLILSHCRGVSSISRLSSTESNDNECSPFSGSNTSLDNKESIEENWEAIRKDVKTELTALENLSKAEQEQRLMETEQKLVTKRYKILDELAEMSGNLRQWHMERDLQTSLVAEVKKLREQLRIAEERLQMQRNCIKTVGPKVIAAHRKINLGRQECFKLSKVCSVLGSKIVGKSYKLPVAGAQLLNNRIKEVACHTRQLSLKKVPSIDIPEISSPQNRTYSTNLESILTDERLPSKNNDLKNIDALTSNEDDYSVDSNDSEEAVALESTVIHAEEKQTENSAPTELSVQNESISEQDNNILNMQPELTSTPVTSKRDNPQHKETPENTNPTPEYNLEKQCCAKPEVDQQFKKVPIPYVSILAHFKVPRYYLLTKHKMDEAKQLQAEATPEDGKLSFIMPGVLCTN